MSTRDGDRPGDEGHRLLWGQLVETEAGLHDLRRGLAGVRVVLGVLADRVDELARKVAEAHRTNRLMAQRDEEDRSA